MKLNIKTFMDNKDYIDKITKHYNDLHDEYKKLDSILKDNHDLLLYLDNERNLYAYSDKIKLFEALEMIIKGNSGYSNIDLVNRVIHYIATQYTLFSDIDESESNILHPIIVMVQDINYILMHLCKTVIDIINIEDLPTFISKWVTFTPLFMRNIKRGDVK